MKIKRQFKEHLICQKGDNKKEAKSRNEIFMAQAEAWNFLV